MQTQPSHFRSPFRNPFIPRACAAAAMLFLAGCSSGPMELVGDETEATELVTAALDAWKSGQKPDQLREDKPAVHVADHDWQAGAALKSFELTGPPLEAGGHWRVNALLTLSSGDGYETQKPVAYAVTMEPEITILRADDAVKE